jgi:GT2 family glycosyltransferase
MSLADYQGHEDVFSRLVEQHKNQHAEYVGCYKTNFFCVKIPPIIYRSVGLFDTGFGQAGGEDDDYCIRTYLAGFHVAVATGSYLLHFGGRSTWNGPESIDEWRARERNFIGIFEKKWGPTLSRFLLFRDASILARDAALAAIEQRSGIAGLYKEMLRRDGIAIRQ